MSKTYGKTVVKFNLLHKLSPLMYYCLKGVWGKQRRIQDLKLGGGGGALKKIAPSGGRRENCWGISCEKSRFYAKKSYFSPGSAPGKTNLKFWQLGESKCWYYKLCNGYEVIFLRMLCYNVTGVYTNINAKKYLFILLEIWGQIHSAAVSISSISFSLARHINKNVDIKPILWNNLHQVTLKQRKIGKPNLLLINRQYCTLYRYFNFCFA